MFIVQKSGGLDWHRPGLEWAAIDRDWFGAALDIPAAYALAIDPTHFWFFASRKAAAHVHPKARAGEFMPGLWQYDVAEFFLSVPESDCYLEFNLAPNGAWWSAAFTAPRVRADQRDLAIPDVQTHARHSADGTWLAAAAIPLDYLESQFDFGAESRMNVSFIIDSPEQRFLSANPPAGGQPDFHRGDLRTRVGIAPKGV